MPAARRSTKTGARAAAESTASEAPPADAMEPCLVDSATLPSEKVAVLRSILFSQIEREVRQGNVRVILWLAERLRIVESADHKDSPTDELRSMLDDLTSQELKEFVSLASD